MSHHGRRPWESIGDEATPEDIFRRRRRLLKALGFGAIALGTIPLWRHGYGLLGLGDEDGEDGAAWSRPALGERFAGRFPAPRSDAYSLGENPLTPEKASSRYNNFYEFTTDKERVWKLARGYPVDPWKVEVRGLAGKPGTIDLETIVGGFPLEERLYRFRCVEAWAMQVPWTGYPLRRLIEKLEPLSSARYVRFVSLLDRERLPGQRSQGQYPWPYYEALRIDEAVHELAFVAVGIYGHALPMQHGAPWRIVLPWKYGFKSIKSVVGIELTEKRPRTFWNDFTPKEYGFYSNINPLKPHPRWSQASERDIGTGKRRPTLPYGGYGELVAKMYRGDEY